MLPVADARRLREQLDQPLAERLAALELALGRLRFELADDRAPSSRAPTSATISASSSRSQVCSSSSPEQRRLDLAAERLARLRHALAQAAEQAAALRSGASSAVPGDAAPAAAPSSSR